MNTTHKNWVRHLLLGTSVVSIMSVAGLATAQEAEPEEEQTEELVDEVVVTGFRSSLEKAQDIKFNADTFVDAITAEDIGALPDRSVAEALQRVPGVRGRARRLINRRACAHFIARDVRHRTRCASSHEMCVIARDVRYPKKMRERKEHEEVFYNIL